MRRGMSPLGKRCRHSDCRTWTSSKRSSPRIRVLTASRRRAAQALRLASKRRRPQKKALRRHCALKASIWTEKPTTKTRTSRERPQMTTLDLQPQQQQWQHLRQLSRRRRLHRHRLQGSCQCPSWASSARRAFRSRHQQSRLLSQRGEEGEMPRQSRTTAERHLSWKRGAVLRGTKMKTRLMLTLRPCAAGETRHSTRDAARQTQR